jgi:hypothetical protein
MQRVGMKSNTFYRRVKEYEYSLKKASSLKRKACFFLIPLFEGMGKNTHDTFGLSSMGLKMVYDTTISI